MAHWDHLGRMPGCSGDCIFNGAVDNATGTSGLLAIAKAFAGSRQKPERSIVFLAVTLEESGLLGSAYYVDNPLFPLAQTVAAFNMDAMHFGGPTRDVTVVNIGASELENYLADAAKAQGRVLMAEPTPEKGTFFRSDHFNFAKRGVPALYIKGGIDDREHGVAWRQKYLADFTAQKYHKVGDEYSPDADLRAGVEDLSLLYAVGAKLAAEKDLSELESGQRISRRARSQPRRGGKVAGTDAGPFRRRGFSGDRAACARLRARTCRCVLLYGSQPCGSEVGNRKSPNKVTFMSWLLFFGSRVGSSSRWRCRARSSAFRSAR